MVASALDSRTLAFPPQGTTPYLVGPRDSASLDVSNMLIGMMPGYEFKSGRVEVAPGSSLFLFSDGAFEIEAADGREWGIEDLVPLLVEPSQPGKPESQRVLETVKSRAGRQSFEDDFTLVVATFA